MTKIEWCQRPGTIPESWSPVTGCNVDGKRIKASPGCDHCWAERMARRLAGRFGYPEQPCHFDVTLHPDRLNIPLRWRKPRTVFVSSMGDLFHEDVHEEFVETVYRLAEHNKQHTFLFLTKRPVRMLELVERFTRRYHSPEYYIPGGISHEVSDNIWLGVTVENQRAADERIPLLLQTPAAVRFVSCEPLLGPINLSPHLPQECAVHRAIHRGGRDCLRPRDDQPVCLDWAIIGGESGPGARPMHPDWVRLLRDQCQVADVPFFFKQHGAWLHESQFVSDRQRIAGLSSKRCEAGDGLQFIRIGKRRAGHLLDGRQWNEWPK